MDGAAIVGLISGLISIIDATKTIYDAAKDTKGQIRAFREVAARLPLVNEILHRAIERTHTIDESEQEALEPILESCKAKAENLEKLFQRVIREDDDKWYDRYKKAADSLLKGGRVESLMGEILRDIQLIACERLMGTATEVQMKELEEAINEMNEMPPSLPDEARSVTQTHNGSGDNIGHTGPGTMNINKGEGVFYSNTIAGNATFGSKN